MTDSNIFHSWNSLPIEMKLECIKKMNLKTRYSLRNTSRTERALVETQRFDLKDLVLMEREGPIVEFSVENSGHNDVFRWIKGKDYITETLLPLLSFIFSHANLGSFLFYHRLGRVGITESTLLSRIEGSNFDVKKMTLGTLPQVIPENWFLEKCAPNSIEYLKFNFGHCEETMPLDRMLSYPSINNVRLWEISCSYCYLVDTLRMAKRWIETDAEIESRMVGNQGEEYNWNDYFEAFECFKIIEKSEHRIRFETNNPKKHMILRFTDLNGEEDEGTSGLLLVVVSADAEKSDYEAYFNI